MSTNETISPAIVDALYEEALQLAEETRTVFERANSAFPYDDSDSDSTLRMALSCEAMRATTRLMHALAWLLNHRAYFAGEMSELQLRRHGRLPPPQPDSNPEQLLLIDPVTRNLISRTIALFERVARLDRAWNDIVEDERQAIRQLRDRLGQAFPAI
ncbi:DUF1465 family protein [Erythrobacter alti]|uniref:DUF1465 family protein n=1 Tax=Erythrobacter alti TaxID=1896145 RepID=UPI0030F41C1A